MHMFLDMGQGKMLITKCVTAAFHLFHIKKSLLHSVFLLFFPHSLFSYTVNFEFDSILRSMRMTKKNQILFYIPRMTTTSRQILSYTLMTYPCMLMKMLMQSFQMNMMDSLKCQNILPPILIPWLLKYIWIWTENYTQTY